MTDKQLLEQIRERTENIHRLFQSHNPYSLPSETIPVYHALMDEVRRMDMDVRVALRNYDGLLNEHNANLAKDQDVAMFESSEFAIA